MGNDAHRTKNNHLQQVLERSTDLAAAFDGSGDLLFANAAWRRSFFRDDGEPQPSLWACVAAGDRDVWRDRIRRVAKQNQPQPFEADFIRPDKQRCPLQGELLALTDEAAGCNGFLVMLHPWHDEMAVTAEPMPIDAGLEWQQLEKFFALNLGLLCIADMEGRFVKVNPAWAEVMGYPATALIGRSCMDFVHPDDAAATRKSVERLGDKQVVTNTVNRYRCSDGSYRWLEWRSQQDGGRIYAAARDVTDRVQLEQELRDQTEQFQLAIRGSNDGIWDWSVTTDDLYLSPKWKQQLGYEDHELANTYATFERLLHPDDAPRVLATVREYLNGHITLYDNQFRLLCKEGSYRWVRSRGAAIRDRDGQVYRMAGSHTDITDSKEAQEALAESEAKFRAISESALDAIVLMDSEARVRYWSPAAAAMFDYTSVEAMHRNIHELIMPKRFLTQFIKNYRKTIKTGQGAGLNQLLEVTTLHRSGREIPVEIALAAVRVRGEQWASAIIRDITARREAVETLSHWHDLVRYIIQHNRSAVAVHDRDLRYMFVSKPYLEQYGVEEDRIIGKHHYEVFPDLPQKWRDVHQRALRGEVSSAEEDPYPRADGTVDWTRWECRPWYEKDGSIGGIVIYTEVITERKEMEEAIANEREQFWTTLFSVHDGVIATDKRGKITLINRTAENLIGWQQDQVVGLAVTKILQIVDETTGLALDDPTRTVLSTGESLELAGPLQLLDRQGAAVAIAGSAAPITNQQGDVTGVVMVFRDVEKERDRDAQMEYLSLHDHLTGLYNRRYMEQAMRQLDSEHNLPVAILVTDVNGLKLTNDAFGPEMGDALLKEVAGILRDVCPPAACVCRVGGDEFVVLLTQTDQTTIDTIRERLLAATKQVVLGSVIVSLAVGTAVKTTMDQTLFDVQKEADNEMYKNKLRGGKIMRSQTIETVLRNINSKYASEQIHTERVSLYCERIAQAMDLTEDVVEDAKIAAVLHDIGKIMVPAEILNKTGKLTPEEWLEIQRHPVIGYQILKGVDEYAGLANAVLYHHERWDGTGYPEGLQTHEIPQLSRIIAVADAFEAMTAIRSYQPPRSKDEAVAELLRCAGTQFDPEVVAVFTSAVLAE